MQIQRTITTEPVENNEATRMDVDDDDNNEKTVSWDITSGTYQIHHRQDAVEGCLMLGKVARISVRKGESRRGKPWESVCIYSRR